MRGNSTCENLSDSLPHALTRLSDALRVILQGAVPRQSCTARFMYDGNASVQNPSKSRHRLQSSRRCTRLWFMLTAPLMGLGNTVAATSTCSQQAEAAAWMTGAAVRSNRGRCPGRHIGPPCRPARDEVTAAVQGALGSPRPPTCPLPPAALDFYGQSECSFVKVMVHRQCQVADCGKSVTSFSAAYQKQRAAAHGAILPHTAKSYRSGACIFSDSASTTLKPALIACARPPPPAPGQCSPAVCTDRRVAARSL